MMKSWTDEDFLHSDTVAGRSRHIRDMMIVTSTDEGVSFVHPILISADNWNIDGCPHTGPSLCSNKSELLSRWYTVRKRNRYLLCHKSKTDIVTGEKPHTVIYYRMNKDGSEIEKAILTPKDANAFAPVATQLKEDFSLMISDII